MAYLILDLDLTTFKATLLRENSSADPMEYFIDEFHTLTEVPTLATVMNGYASAKIELINAPELAKLIEDACTRHDGLIILTAGLWDASVRDLLAEHLDLSPVARQKVRECFFHSPLTDEPLFNLPALEIRQLPKNQRLEKIIAYHQIKGRKFVLLDDDEYHITSFDSTKLQTKAILATREEPDKSYYEKAHAALASASRKEKRVLHPNNAYNGKIKVSFFDSKKRSRDETENAKENTAPKRIRLD